MRHQFLGDLSAWAFDLGADETSVGGADAKHALVVPGGTLQFYNARSNGTQYTDLLDQLNTAITAVPADEFGEFPTIWGPDTDPDTWYMFADGSGGAGPRRLVVATDMGDTLNALGDLVGDLQATITAQQDLLAHSLGVVLQDATTGAWPTRPSDSRPYLWMGTTAPPTGAGGMVDGLDNWYNPRPVT